MPGGRDVEIEVQKFTTCNCCYTIFAVKDGRKIGEATVHLIKGEGENEEKFVGCIGHVFLEENERAVSELFTQKIAIFAREEGCDKIMPSVYFRDKDMYAP